MGCGALCGDTTTLDTALNHHTKSAYSILIQQLQANPGLISNEPYISFIDKYSRLPNQFQIESKEKLVQGQQIRPGLLLKWKLILLGLDKEDKTYSECVQPIENSLPSSFKWDGCNKSNEIIYHASFEQIEKDISRTFDTSISQSRKKQFEHALKRIANHFPKMGYTQGINFIVSYLFVLGYSQNDCFSIFVHLATNKRYLLLGLFEDGFPLYSALVIIFENTLKRVNQLVYVHMFDTLCIDASMWICKWFMTFFIYSFPKQLIKYIWDVVIGVGILGIITVSISLINQVSSYILQISQLSDLDQFLTSLRNIQSFNQHINLQHLLIKAYSMELTLSDFDHLNTHTNFYASLLKDLFKLRATNTDQQQLNRTGLQEKVGTALHQWRMKLVEQRKQFVISNQNFDLQVESLTPKTNTKQQVSYEKVEQASIHLDDPHMMVSTSETAKQHNSFSGRSQTPITINHKFQYMFNQINEGIQQEEQSTKSKNDKHSRKPRKSMNDGLDQLDKLQIEFDQKKLQTIKNTSNLLKKSANNILNQPIIPNVSAFDKIEATTLGLVGHISIRNDRSFDQISVSSKQASDRSKKAQKDESRSKAARGCGCKTKTEENNLGVVGVNQQSNAQLSEQNQINKVKYSQRGEKGKNSWGRRGLDSYRQRPININKNSFMINSHGPNALKKTNNNEVEGKPQNDIEVVVLQFKKNRNGINYPASPTEELPHSRLGQNGWGHQQQQIQSVNQIDETSQAHSYCSQSNNYQIESVR